MRQSDIFFLNIFGPYTDYVVRENGLEEHEHCLKTGRRNFNYYTDGITLIAQNASDLQVLTMKVKKYNENMGPRLNLKTT